LTDLDGPLESAISQVMMALAGDYPKAFFSNHWNIGSCQGQRVASSVFNQVKEKSIYRVRKNSLVASKKMNQPPLNLIAWEQSASKIGRQL
jgi:hypothetical protein